MDSPILNPLLAGGPYRVESFNGLYWVSNGKGENCMTFIGVPLRGSPACTTKQEAERLLAALTNG
jgi:hypothetical protein